MSLQSFQTSDGVRLGYEDLGSGRPIVFQHGLGADRSQPAEAFHDLRGWRRITLECRGHGTSEIGDAGSLSISRFATDVAELATHLGLASFVAGGISMGAAIAVNLAVHRRELIDGLILARPAWLTAAAPPNMQPYLEVADLLQHFGPVEGATLFAASETYRKVQQVSPDNAQSLLWFFERSRSDSTEGLLSRIPLDGPGISADELALLDMPVMIIASDRDYVHPLAIARALAAAIPGAMLKEIAAKSVSKTRHVEEMRKAIQDYLGNRRD